MSSDHISPRQSSAAEVEAIHVSLYMSLTSKSFSNSYIPKSARRFRLPHPFAQMLCQLVCGQPNNPYYPYYQRLL
jgi:hypothetical protein